MITAHPENILNTWKSIHCIVEGQSLVLNSKFESFCVIFLMIQTLQEAERFHNFMRKMEISFVFRNAEPRVMIHMKALDDWWKIFIKKPFSVDCRDFLWWYRQSLKSLQFSFCSFKSMMLYGAIYIFNIIKFYARLTFETSERFRGKNQFNDFSNPILHTVDIRNWK